MSLKPTNGWCTTSPPQMTLCSAQEYLDSSSKEIVHASQISLQETPSVPLPLALKHTQTHSTLQLSQVSVCITMAHQSEVNVGSKQLLSLETFLVYLVLVC